MRRVLSVVCGTLALRPTICRAQYSEILSVQAWQPRSWWGILEYSVIFGLGVLVLFKIVQQGLSRL